MKKIFTTIILLVSTSIMIQAAKPRTSLKVSSTRKQTVTGFGGACCDGAMKPFGTDNACVSKLYGAKSKIGLNILRMEISPSFTGDNWGDYDWNGSLPSAQIVKKRDGIVFGTPWSPPGEYKTNGTAQGGNADDQGNQKGKLREDCYDKFFPWLNTFLKWMKSKGVVMDAVSIQNEPDWWVSYSGCLYEPEEQVTLIKNYANLLDREAYDGVRIISAEPLGFRKDYYDALLADETCREQVDIFAGHIYGHMPLQYIKPVAQTALPLGKEVWMTEHSATDNIDHLPNWQDNMIFAQELNECMLAGCTGYIYWYLRAHWAFCGTGQSWTYRKDNVEYTANSPDNKKDELLPRAYVMSHFSKNVTGSTRLKTSQDESAGRTKEEILQNEQFSAYIKGDSIIVMAINAREDTRDVKITLPYNVKSGVLWLSTGNESSKLCQKSNLEDITEPVSDYLYEMPAQSLNTLIFMIDRGSTAIENVKLSADDGPKTYYDLQGRRLDDPHGLCIERSANGDSRKVYMGR
jgi:glucuronoarabinoxylan endo-1,4-beta-xylanase